MKLMLGGRSVEIGSKIKKSRIDAKLTQEQAAEALGISRQTISNWENEKSYPDIDFILSGDMGIQYHGVVVFSAERISEAQAGAFQWLVLPVATIVISLLIGKNDFWGKRKWFAPIGFGLMFLLSIYASYGMRENSIFNQIDLQTITFFFIGAIASVIGIVLGYAFFTVKKNTPKSE